MTKRKVLAVVSACALLLTMFVSLIPVYAGKPDDTTGWTLGEGSTIAGNPDYGWTLNQAGCNQDRQAKYQNKYETDISLRDLQVQFKADYSANGLWTLTLADRDLDPLPGLDVLGDNGICLIIEKAGENAIRVQRWAGSPAYAFEIYNVPFDFSETHTLHFVEQDGKWYVAIDDIVFNESLGGMQVNVEDGTNVSSILDATDGKGTIVESLSDPAVTFPYINFTENNPTEGWTIGAGSSITANADGGWTLNQAASGQNRYVSDISLRDMQMEFQANYAGNTWWAVAFSDEGLSMLPNNETLGDTGICLLIEKASDSSIHVQRWSSGTAGTVANYLYQVRDIPFDFSATHMLHFVERDGKWYIAIDDIVFDAEYIPDDYLYVAGSEDVSSILTAMDGKQTVFDSSSACEITFPYINFTEAEESYDPASEWKLNGSATIEGDATNGFTLVGDRGVEAKYQEAIDLSTQSVRLKFNHTTAWQAVNFTTTSNPTGLVDASSDNLTMLFSFNGETTLRVSVWLGGEEAESAIAYIDNFDRNAEHTVGFTKRENNWYLNFDGVVYTSPAEESKGITARLTQALDNMTVNTAYAGLHSYGGEQGTEINVSGFRFVNTTVSQVGDWRLNGTVTIEDNGENGFNLAGSGNSQTKYQKPIDLSTQSVKLQLNHTGEWQGINFTTSREPNGVTNPSADALTLILGREGNELRASIWIGDVAGGESQGEGCVVRIPEFAWNEEHTFGFSKVEDSWYLNIDGRVYTEPIEGSKGITGYVTAALENMVTVPTYAGVINAEKVDLAITGYRYVSTETPEVQTDWRLSGTVTAEGDATNGYDVAGNGKAAYKTPFDLTMKSVTMTFEPGIGQWNALHFGNTDAVSDLDIPTESHLSLVITHGGGNTGIDENTARISLWMEKTKEDGSKYNAEAAIAYLNNFDFSAAHSFGFSEMDGSWYLNVDGKLCTQPDAGVTELITAMVENMAGRYLCFPANFGWRFCHRRFPHHRHRSSG